MQTRILSKNEVLEEILFDAFDLLLSSCKLGKFTWVYLTSFQTRVSRK